MRNMKNIKVLGIFLILILGTLTLNSCDELIDPTETDFGKGPVLATFTQTTAELNIIKDVANTPATYEFEITYFGGKNVALDKAVTVNIAASPLSQIPEGTGFTLSSSTYTIPAGSTTVTGTITIATAPLVPFDFKKLILEITDSSESVSEKNTFSLTLKALGANTLAGDYTVVDGQYWNSGRFLGDYDGNHVTISALAPGLYSHPGIGPFDGGGTFYFTVDDTTGKITVLTKSPAGVPTLLNGSPIMTCEGNNPFEMITCDPALTNKSTLKTDGHHEVITSVGYFRGTGATREFFEKLVRD